MSYLDELNPSQREAAENIYGPTMVIAGAGSGKTRVLTFRIAYMLEQGIDPFNIMSLTFTNKAAREMTDRIGKIVGSSEAKNITSEEKVIVDKAIKEVLSELKNTVVIENFKEQAANLQAMQQEKSKPRLGRRILSRGI